MKIYGNNNLRSIILSAYWGPEIRNMVFSGLVHRLAENVPVVLLSRVTDGSFIKQIPSGCELVEMPQIDVPRTVGRIIALANKSHGFWMDNKGMSRGLESKAGMEKPTLTKAGAIKNHTANLFARNFLTSVLGIFENRLFLSWVRSNKDVQVLIRRLNPKSFLCMDTVHPISRLFAQIVRGLGGKSIYFSGNWKDISRGFRARPCFDTFLVWNKAMATDLIRQNPHLNKRRIEIVGSPQFDLHLRHSLLLKRRDYCRSLRLDPLLPILCYTAAAKKVIPKEATTVRRLCDAIQKQLIVGNPYIVVRLNPIGSDPEFEKLPKIFDFVRLSRPRWDSRPDLPGGPWQASDFDDLSLYLNTIYHSAMNISAPSTVTLDFAVVDKPILNVGYDPPGVIVKGQSVKTFSSQDVYLEAMECGACRICREANHMHQFINNYLRDPTQDSEGRSAFVTKQLGTNLGKSVEMITRALTA